MKSADEWIREMAMPGSDLATVSVAEIARIQHDAVRDLVDALGETIGVWCNHVPGDERCAPIHRALNAALSPAKAPAS